MADNRFMNTAAADASQIDVGLRSYMLGVYNHMTIALLFSGLRYWRRLVSAMMNRALAPNMKRNSANVPVVTAYV